MRQILVSSIFLLVTVTCLAQDVPFDETLVDPNDPELDELEGSQGGRGMLRKFLAGTLKTATGTAFSAVNFVGQEINNAAGGGNLIGQIGSTLTQIAERGAGSIKFNLFTPKNPKEPYLLTPSTVGGSPYDKTQNTIAIIHGFTPVGYFEKAEDNIISSLRVKDGLLQNAKLTANIIVVDWTALSSDGVYLFSSTSTSTTADRLSSLLVWLLQNGYIPSPKNIRVIGHSLGGHTAGITGKKFYEKYKLAKMGRIDAIDPAGPNFDHVLSYFQLSPTNADTVTVMHCNIGFLGSQQNRGTIDFYPNGGDNLPGCEEESLNATETVSETRKRRSVSTHICNHVRCIDLYIELLEDEKLGCPCPSWEDFIGDKCDCKVPNPPRMGYYCPDNATGVYYLNITMRTKFEPPKSMNLTALEITSTSTTTPAPEVG